MRFLGGDIGGTKTLLAIFREEGDRLIIERQEKYISSDHKGLEDIIQKFQTEKVGVACFGIAGTIKNGICRTTNLPWVVDAQKIATQFNINNVFLINDLQANAYGLKGLSSKDLYTLNQGVESKGNRVLISAGTGLGESLLFFDGNDHVPLASEGGHSDFAPRDDLEIELFKYLRKQFGHVSYERVLSGQGLVNLYRFLIDGGYEKEGIEVKEQMENGVDQAVIVSKFGISSEDPACKRVLEWFCSLYAAEAGNLALKVVAMGGVFLGGGIAPKIIKAFKKEEFLKSFSDKGRFSDFLRDIPVHIVLEEQTALFGASYFCQRFIRHHLVGG